MDFHEVMAHPLPSPEGGIRAMDPQLAPQSGTIVAQQPPTPTPIYHSRGPRCVHPHYTLRFGAKPILFYSIVSITGQQSKNLAVLALR